MSVTAKIIAVALALLVWSMPTWAMEKSLRAEVLIGEVTIQQFPEVGIGVIVNRIGGSGTDEIAERVIILQTQNEPAVDLPLTFVVGQVIFKKDHVVAISLKEPVAVGLFLEGVEESIVENLIERARRGVAEELLDAGLRERYQRLGTEQEILVGGYGLSRHDGEFALPMASWPPARPAATLAPKASEPPLTRKSTCYSGGPGSSSCDITCVVGGCGVTCQDGYYACCGCGWTPSCNCVEDGSGGRQCPPCEPLDDN